MGREWEAMQMTAFLVLLGVAGALVAIIFIAALVNALHPEHRHDGRA